MKLFIKMERRNDDEAAKVAVNWRSENENNVLAIADGFVYTFNVLSNEITDESIHCLERCAHSGMMMQAIIPSISMEPLNVWQNL